LTREAKGIIGAAKDVPQGLGFIVSRNQHDRFSRGQQHSREERDPVHI
jgi:hypothetical protein